MSAVAVYSHVHAVVYVADNILKSMKDILVCSGLDPQKLADQYEILLRGIKRWIETGHLEQVVLEVYNPTTNGLIGRWDIDVIYSYSETAGTFWTDTEQVKYAIRKAGIYPSQADYRIVVDTKNGFPAVEGWSNTSLRSTEGMVRQSLGTTIDHNGLGAGTSYWRKTA